MRRFFARYLYLIFILIDRGSLGVQLAPANSRKGLDIDLNVEAQPEEEPLITSSSKGLGFDLNVPPAEERLSFTPVDSAPSPPASSIVIAPTEGHDLARDKTESLTASSTGINSMPTLGSTSANKRKRIAEVYVPDERDQNPSKKKPGVGGASKSTRENQGKNTFQLGAVERAPKMKKLKEVMATRQHGKYRTKPKSARPGYPSEVSTFFLDWTYVKVDKVPAILKEYLRSSPRRRNEKDLFKYLKTLPNSKQENSAGVFWIPRGHEKDFFEAYRKEDSHINFIYPRGLKTAHRASAILKLIVQIYDEKISRLNKENLQFLKAIKTRFHLKSIH
ncbi:hypothetical protein PCASD_03867 [Puccinia coronata f. sp. avenae]|uniref:Uncharacterized protein n=2 Tax=Puccinia coronata f. sp. avenae TaxID=200324 RepID=A0A2N5V2J6_9BASI|nr:hypothetical protein PCASD_03867 [Puccinia coronata f. sp. avenae]